MAQTCGRTHKTQGNRVCTSVTGVCYACVYLYPDMFVYVCVDTHRWILNPEPMTGGRLAA